MMIFWKKYHEIDCKESSIVKIGVKIKSSTQYTNEELIIYCLSLKPVKNRLASNP